MREGRIFFYQSLSQKEEKAEAEEGARGEKGAKGGCGRRRYLLQHVESVHLFNRQILTRKGQRGNKQGGEVGSVEEKREKGSFCGD